MRYGSSRLLLVRIALQPSRDHENAMKQIPSRYSDSDARTVSLYREPTPINLGSE